MKAYPRVYYWFVVFIEVLRVCSEAFHQQWREKCLDTSSSLVAMNWRRICCDPNPRRKISVYFTIFSVKLLLFWGLNWIEISFKGLLKTTIAGGFGGICLWTSIFPFDVVKSRIQIESSREKMLTVLLRIARKEGIRGLYNGLTPTLLRTFPATGALFVAVENTKELLTKGVDKILWLLVIIRNRQYLIVLNLSFISNVFHSKYIFMF